MTTELTEFSMQLPIEQQKKVLAEYTERRQCFRDWLMAQLIEGVHYGVPPGCEPKTKIINGVLHYGVWNKRANGGQGGHAWHPHTQWTPKPSLYKAGADFVCDLMRLVDRYEADRDAWEQLGSVKGTFVFTARLYPKGVKPEEDQILGEGRGIGIAGKDPNAAIKMAKKRAKVDAVLNAFGLADLFTQDVEDSPPEQPADDPSQRRMQRWTTAINEAFGKRDSERLDMAIEKVREFQGSGQFSEEQAGALIALAEEYKEKIDLEGATISDEDDIAF